MQRACVLLTLASIVVGLVLAPLASVPINAQDPQSAKPPEKKPPYQMVLASNSKGYEALRFKPGGQKGSATNGTAASAT